MVLRNSKTKSGIVNSLCRKKKLFHPVLCWEIINNKRGKNLLEFTNSSHLCKIVCGCNRMLQFSVKEKQPPGIITIGQGETGKIRKSVFG